jgi:phage gpG-like protein
MIVTTEIKERNFAVVLKSAKEIEPRLIASAGRGLARGLEGAVSIVQLQFLSGPRPARLDIVTGCLIKSITSEVTITDQGAAGRLGTNVIYGARHEFGFTGTESVQAHTRITGQFNAKGVEISDRRILKRSETGEIELRETARAAARRQRSGYVAFSQVKAHTRRISYKGRPFIRPGLEKALPMILGQIEKELANA